MVRHHRTLKISGIVQGVWYRKSALSKAKELQLSGTARNLENGDVEIHMEGELPQLEAFTIWAWKGPPEAKVSEVRITDTEAQGLRGLLVIP